MDQESHPDLSHGSLPFQNNSITHANSASVLNSSHQNSSDCSRLTQQPLKYLSNTAYPAQQFQQNQGPNSILHSPDLPGAGVAAHIAATNPQVASDLNPRSSGGYMVPTSCQSLNNYPEIGDVRPLMTTQYANNTAPTPVVRGSLPASSYVSQPSQLCSVTNSRFSVQTYTSTMTSSSLQTPQAGASSTSTTDPEKRQLIQQQLILLLHARGCRQDAERSGRTAPCTKPHCRTMRNVLQHMQGCSMGKNCQMPHCASSRQIISHWKNCSSRECPVCEPLKRDQNQRQFIPRQYVQPLPTAPQSVEVNGLPNTQQPNSIRTQVATTSNRNVIVSASSLKPALAAPMRSAGIYSQPTAGSHSGLVQSGSATTSGITEQPDWRDEVSMEQRNHVVRRIVKYILPQPDPAAYSDPRMTNLIDYARKVENAMYQSAKDIEEYFHLLSERCYKIYKELEEIRKKRRNATVTTTTTTPTSSTSCDSFSGSNRSGISPSGQNHPGLSNSNSAIRSSLPGSNLDFHPSNCESPESSGLRRGSNDEANLAQFDRVLQSAHDRYSMKSENGSSIKSVHAPGNSSLTDLPNQSVTTCKVDEDDKSTVYPSLTNASVNEISTKQVAIKTEEPLKSDPLSGDPRPSTGFDPLSVTPSTAVAKINEHNWKKWSREELLRHFLSLHAEIFNDRNAEPFRDPVDPVALNIPDYPQVIKQPMDLTTIRNNLEDGNYKNPWDILDNFRLMFNNAWLYNKKNSRVYKMCNKLSELFESQVDQVMQAMGFCCGHEYSYQQLLYCSSPNVCTINRDAYYYIYANTDKKALICDNYYQCEKCFNDAGDEIMLADETNQAPVPIKKELFKRKKNNVTIEEPNVICNDCGRRWHKVCALHMNKIWPSGFVCPGCLRERGTKRKDNRFNAKSLPCNKLSIFLEKRVNDFLKKKEVGTGEVTIRVLASSDKNVEVRPLMRGRFTESGELSESFPYRLKAIFAFQEIDGQDVCFFGLYIQEYGSESPQPNRRRVYVAYLDSVFYFRPKQYRTDVYHEILVGYLLYAKQCGFTMAHIWACPPGEGDDYIFHQHPIEQRIPKAKRLQDWYRRMLQKAMIEGIVVDFKDILKDAIDHHLVSPTEIPYFEGDFWPNTLEEILQDLDKEEERRRREEALAEEEDDDGDCLRGNEGGIGDGDKRSGKKKAKKRKGNKKAGLSTMSKRKKLDGPVDGITELSRKVYDTMEKLKEIFFVIRLHRNSTAASLPPIVDPDSLIPSELMESRDSFLQMAREKHLEFSSLRRAKYSTMVMLYELHNEGRQAFMYNCNVCEAQIETRWHCNECEEYDLCTRCYKRENHPHSMVQYGFGIDEDGSSTNGASTEKLSGNVDRKTSFESCIKALVHACQCRDANCRISTCVQMKRVLGHTRTCVKRANGTCQVCKQLVCMCCFHAKSCEDDQCFVPLCSHIKDRFKQQQIQKRRQQNKSLQRRTNLTRGATNAVVGDSASTQHHSSSSSVDTSESARTLTGQPVGHILKGSSSFLSSADAINVQTSIGNSNPGSLNGISGSSLTSAPQSQSRVIPNQQQLSRMSMPQIMISSSQMSSQQQPLSSASAALRNQSPTVSIVGTGVSGGSSGVFRTLARTDISAIAAKATPQEIDRVYQVMNLIRATKASSDEKNKQFTTWIKRHPEYHPAFFVLHDKNRQVAGANQQHCQQAASGSLPIASSSSTSVPSTISGPSNSNNSSVLHTNSVRNSLQSQQQQPGMGSIISISGSNATKQVILNNAFQQQQQVQQPQAVQWVLQQGSVKPGSKATTTLQPITVQQHQPPTTLRFRAMPGSATVVQSQSNVQGSAQQVYASGAMSNNTNNGGTVYVGTTAAGNNMGGTTLTNLSHGQQQPHILSQQRIIPAPMSSIARTVATTIPSGPTSSIQPPPVVHFRTSGGQQPNQPHILLQSNPGQQPQQQVTHSQVVTPGRPGGPIVTVMSNSSQVQKTTQNILPPPSGS